MFTTDFLGFIWNLFVQNHGWFWDRVGDMGQFFAGLYFQHTLWVLIISFLIGAVIAFWDTIEHFERERWERYGWMLAWLILWWLIFALAFLVLGVVVFYGLWILVGAFALIGAFFLLFLDGGRWVLSLIIR